MGLQDLTPQLRTRLSRVERAVGVFVTAATLLLVAGFGYYIYHTAERKGWFKTRIEYSTGLNNAAGLKAGDPVKLMGFTVGTLTRVEANAPDDPDFGVTVFFRILEPYYGYVWLDSKVRVAPADFLGHRNLEIIKGQSGAPTVISTEKKEVKVLKSQTVHDQLKEIRASLETKIHESAPGFTPYAVKIEAELQSTNVLNQMIREQPALFYTNRAGAKPYWIEPLESPALTERLETLVSSAESALPNLLNLTNQLSAVLSNAAKATEKLDSVLTAAQPLVTNLNFIAGNIRDPKGSLGEWIIPTNLNVQLERTLKTADTTLANTDSNLTSVATNLDRTLENLANVTSNLNAQVQANSHILDHVSEAVVHSDEFVQGLKHHWLLRSAFKKKGDKKDPPKVLRSPKDKELQD